jgi:hypothetical protein
MKRRLKHVSLTLAILSLAGMLIANPLADWTLSSPGASGVPTCSIAFPASDAFVLSTIDVRVQFEGRGEGQAVVKELALILDGESVLATQTLIPPRSSGEITFAVDTTILPDGPYVLVAMARQGNHVGASEPINIHVKNFPPEPIDLLPGIQAKDAFSVRWQAPLGDPVRYDLRVSTTAFTQLPRPRRAWILARALPGRQSMRCSSG